MPWLKALITHLAEANSRCVVRLANVFVSSDWGLWKHPRLQIVRADYEDKYAETLQCIEQADISHLKQLALRGPQLTTLEALAGGRFSRLQELELMSMQSLTSLRGLAGADLCQLETLRMVECGAVTLEGLMRAGLSQLRHLEIKSGRCLHSLRGIAEGGLTQLVSVALTDCTALTS